MEPSVLEETSVAVGEHKAVAVEEVWGVRCISHNVAPESDSDGCHTDCTTVQLVKSTFSRCQSTYPGCPPPNCWQRSAMRSRKVLSTTSCWLLEPFTREEVMMLGSDVKEGIFAILKSNAPAEAPL